MSLKTVPLRHVADVRVSNVDKKSIEGEKSVRLCNYTDVYYRGSITSEIDFMQATATTAQIRAFALKAGDILITKDSETADDIAVPAYVPEDLPGVVCGYHLAVIRPRKAEIDPRYLSWALRSDFMRDQFTNRASGVTRYGLTYGAIQGSEVPIVDATSQLRIADFLDDQVTRIDQARDLQQKQIMLLAERFASRLEGTMRAAADGATTSMRSVLTQPPQYGANAAAEHEERSWPRFIRTTDLTGDGMLRDETFRSLPFAQARPYMLDEGDLLFTRSGATVGKSFIYTTAWGPACFAGYLIRLRVDRRRVRPEWIRMFCDTPWYWSQIREAQVQSHYRECQRGTVREPGIPVAIVARAGPSPEFAYLGGDRCSRMSPPDRIVMRALGRAQAGSDNGRRHGGVRCVHGIDTRRLRGDRMTGER